MKQINNKTSYRRSIKREALALPLMEGWYQRSTDKGVEYYNPTTNESTMERPTPPALKQTIHLSALKVVMPLRGPVLANSPVSLDLYGSSANIASCEAGLQKFIHDHRCEKSLDQKIMRELRAHKNLKELQDLLLSQHCVTLTRKTGTQALIFTLEGTKGNIQDAERTIINWLWSMSERAHQVPDHWITQENSNGYQLVRLSPDDPEFERVCAILQETLPGATLNDLERVENHILWRDFNGQLNRAKHICQRPDVTKELFHGTSRTDPGEVCRDGFVRNFSSAGMWGIGTYFAVNAAYSNSGYAFLKDGKRQLFLAEVITGAVHVQHNSDCNIRVAPMNEETGKRFDSIEGFTNGSIIYITYEDFRAYPKYILTYTSA
jgi:hypothetical protein